MTTEEFCHYMRPIEDRIKELILPSNFLQMSPNADLV